MLTFQSIFHLPFTIVHCLTNWVYIFNLSCPISHILLYRHSFSLSLYFVLKRGLKKKRVSVVHSCSSLELMKEGGGRKQGAASPCAACKLLRRRCAQDCVFAPYFPADEPQKFANVHKVFGASNVNKMLQVHLFNYY